MRGLLSAHSPRVHVLAYFSPAGQPVGQTTMMQGLLSVCLAGAAAAANMNGDYVIANPVEGRPFASDHEGEWFELSTPTAKMQYSGVYWTLMPEVALPDDVVRRFDGKIMAITGWEADQYRRTKDGDVKAPMYEVYNHHFEARLLSNKTAQLVGLKDGVLPPGGGHRVKTDIVSRDAMAGRPLLEPFTPSDMTAAPAPETIAKVPLYILHGGEYRKSFNGYPVGYAHLLESPTTLGVAPMLVDTMSRSPGYKPEGGFAPGPLPKVSTAPAGANYSGLLECPCSTRRAMKVTDVYGTCTSSRSTRITSVESCFAAGAAALGSSARNVTAARADAPAGCSVGHDGAGDFVLFNTAAGGAACAGGTTFAGAMTSLTQMGLNVDSDAGNVTITLSGPDGVWFGVGFDAQAMGDQPYGLLVDGEGTVEEHRIGTGAGGLRSAGTVLAAQVEVVRNGVSGGVRTVVLTRGLVGKTAQHYTFAAATGVVPMINAVGDTSAIAYHKLRTASQVTMLNTGSCTPLCVESVSKTIDGIPFDKVCADEPYTDLLKLNNSVCHFETYRGGLECCKHGVFLLDADQAVPEETEEYFMKFRFYYKEYTGQTPTVRMMWETEKMRSGTPEYDVPTGNATYTLTSRFTPKDLGIPTLDQQKAAIHRLSDGVELIGMHAHCHAPSCLRMELWNRATNTLICGVDPVYGNGTAAWDEKAYLQALPPCLFSHTNPALQKPVPLAWDTPLESIKVDASGTEHRGVMGYWNLDASILWKQ